MASNFELNIDVAVLEQANRRFETMVTNTAKVSANIKDINATLGGSSSAATIVERISKAFDEISKKTVSPKFDDKNANTYVAALDKIVSFINIISSKGALEIFDNKALYNSSNNLLQNERTLNTVREEIKRVRKEYQDTFKEFEKATFSPTAFNAPINPNTGNAYGKKSQAYMIARAEFEETQKMEYKRFEQTQKFQEEVYLHKQQTKRKELELEMRNLIEFEAIAKKELEWSKMTESEKSAYIEKELQKQLKAEEKRISEAQRLYKSYLSQMNGLSRNINKNEARNDDGAMTATIEKQKASFQRLYDLKTKLEQDYGVHLVQIAEDYNAKALQITADRIRKETDAKKKAEEVQWQKYLSSPEGALTLAKDAKTINQMKEAQKYLQEARGNVDVKDTKTIKALNDEYTRLRATIEKLTTAEKNEQSLQPTLANEYRRLLKELDQVKRSREALAKTSAFQNNDKSARKSYADLVAYEQQLTNKKIELRRAAGDALIPIEREHAARLAQVVVAETEKAERAKFEAERKRLLEIQELRRQTATRSTARANQIVDQSANVKNIAQEEQAVKKLEDARRRLNKNDADYEVTLKRINDAIDQHTHNIKMATDASYREAQAKKQAQQQNTTYQGALNYSKNVKSINDQIKAIKYLKQARANLDRSSMSKSEYEKKVRTLTKEINKQQQEVDKLTGKTGKMKNSMSEIANVANNLKNRLSGLFGLAAIKGYIQQLVNVRKEFERQQTALAGILQSKDKADELWGQTVSLALKSPFSVRELVTYTKQLSAYRIETDKLHDTTKRLADVSAGLGVDMSRLILAYGQVRAAEYLRGTELRQFTEAGIPMLEELAKYFTELEGRAVSTADVFARISKRMVEFEDVEAVIHRMTDEGGIFFQMQEKQSKTLYGEISNLKDAYELMLNDIGKMNQGILLKVIRTVRNLVNNWYDLLPVITSVGYAMTTGVLGAGLISAIKGLSTLIRLLKASKIHLTALSKISFGGWMTLISVLSSVIYYFIEIKNHVDEVTNAFNTLNKEIQGELTQSLGSYRKLVNESNDLTKSYLEREKAMQRLKTQFQDILPDMYLESDYIKSTTNNYREAEDAMKSFYNSKAISMKTQKLEEIYSDKFDEDINDLVGSLAGVYFNGPAGERVFKDWGRAFNLTNEDITSALIKVIENAKKENIVLKDKSDILKELVKELKTYHGISTDFSFMRTDFVNKNLGEILEMVDEYLAKKRTIAGLEFETKQQRLEYEQQLEINNLLSERLELVNQLSTAYTQYVTAQKATEIDEAHVKELKNTINELTGKLNIVETDFDRLVKSEGFYADEILRNVKKQVYQNLIDTYTPQKQKITQGYPFALEDMRADIAKTIKETLGNSNVPEVTRTMMEDVIKTFLNQSKLGRTEDILKSVISGYFETGDEHKQNSLQRWTKQSGKDAYYLAAQQLPTVRIDTSAEKDKLINALVGELTPFAEKLRPDDIIHGVVDMLDKKVYNVDVKTPQAVETLQKKATALDLTDFQEITEGWLKTLAETYKVDLRLLEKLRADEKSTRATLLNDTKANREEWEAELKSFRIALKEAEEKGYDKSEVESTHGLSESQIKTYEARIELAKIYEKLLGGYEKETGSSPKNNLLDVVKIVENLHKDYKDLSKTLTQAESKTSAIKKNTDAFAEAVKGFPSLEKFDLKGFNFDSEEGAIGMLKQLKTLLPENVKNYKDLRVEIEKAIGRISGEQQVEIKVKKDEDLINSIEEMFDGYELSLELDKLGLPKNFMSDLFDIKIFDLSEIKNRINSEITNIQDTKGQEDVLEKLRELLKKVDDMEDKQMQERLKKYSKYLLKSQSEVVKIKLEEARQLAEIESLEGVGSAEKSIMVKGVERETQEKLDKARWDLFKDSHMYIEIFEDLDRASRKSLNAMQKRLRELKTSLHDLYPEQLKEIVRLEGQIFDEKIKRNPFAGLVESYKSLTKARKDLSAAEKQYPTTYDDVLKQYEDQRNAIDTLAQEIEEYKQAYGGDNKVVLTKQDELDRLTKAQEALQKILEIFIKIKDKTEEAEDGFMKSMSEIGSKISEVSSALPTLMGNLEDMGVSFSDKMKDDIESIAEIGEGVGNAIQGFASGNYVQGITGTMQAIAGVFKIGDKNREREIKSLTKNVETLGRAYEKLQKQIENAYSVDQFRTSYAEANQNLEDQINAYDDMIAAEEAKKNTDKERIEEWKKAQEDLIEQQKELEEQRLQELGGFGESGIKSAADDFVDAWLTAYQETGDGLDALEDKWDEYIRNIIKKQMALRIADKFIEPMTTEIDKALDDDATLTKEEAKKIKEEAEKASEGLNDAMHQLANYYGGIDGLFGSGAQLSGLTQGIQGVTEQTADQLAGLVNSIRLYVSDNNAELKRMTEMLSLTAYNQDNPMAEQMRLMAINISSIQTMLESVVQTGHPKGIAGIRVFTDM